MIPIKQGESLPHEAPNEGQAIERLYPSAIPSGFINHEFSQSCKDDDNKRLVTACSSRTMSCELALFALKLAAQRITAQFVRYMKLLYLQLNKVMRELCQSYGSSCGWTYWCATGPNHERKTPESPDRSSHMVCYFLLSVRRSSLTKSPSCDRAIYWIWWWYQIGEAIAQGIKWANSVLLVALCLARTRVDASLTVILFDVISDLLGSEAFEGICVHLTRPWH